MHVNDTPGKAPWPSMRGDARNRGVANNLEWKTHAPAEFCVARFRTGNGIFSTPIIDAEECIYVGSADRRFYAFDPLSGKELWHDDIGGIVDSAACMDDRGTIFLAGGDGMVHAYAKDGMKLWERDFLHAREKRQFSLSSNFWFEANIVTGPDGFLYAGNDDFFLYKLSPVDGSIVWAFRTGFLIWSAPAFGPDGSVYLSGFDQLLYALDSGTGKLLWKLDTRGALVSSPAIGDDGTVYVASFNGNVYAVNPGRGTSERKRKGRIEWAFQTGGHVYASPAIAPDGTVYVGSSSGTFHAIEAATGKEKWRFYIGDAIRCSASVGPDPESKETYIVYFGGGDGIVYAMTPRGSLRWSFDILPRALETDYPNINASVALGNKGLAVASAGGDVVWIPYDHYLNAPDDPCISRDRLFRAPREGPAWHLVTPGGKIEREAIAGTREIYPVTAISIRLLVHLDGSVQPARLDPDSIRITSVPHFEHEFELQSNGSTINIIPRDILHPGTEYAINIHVTCLLEQRALTHDETLVFKAGKVPGNCEITSFKGRSLNIVHMAIPQPAIIPSLNQIGFASLVIPFTIVEHDPDKRKFVAWAVQKFADFVPQERVSVYAFSGRHDGDFFMMEARNCLFEITSFNIFLDTLRFASLIEVGGNARQGGSLVVQKWWERNPFKLVSELGSSSPITASMMMQHLKRVGLKEFLSALGPFTRALIRQLTRNTWASWGLVNHRHRLHGVGTFKIESGEEIAQDISQHFHVVSFLADKKHHRISARVEQKQTTPVAVLRIFLVDVVDMEAVPVNYSNCNRVSVSGTTTSVVLHVPGTIYLGAGRYRAYLMNGLSVIGAIDI